MYSFEGEFRRKPQVSLRGASKREDHGSLLQRNLIERRKREFERRRQRSALRIQKFIRGCLSRSRIKRGLRATWDHDMTLVVKAKVLPDQPTLQKLQNQLLLFYDSAVDQHRLVTFSQFAIQNRAPWLRLLVSHGNSWLHQMRRMLLHNSRLLLLSTDPSSNIATPLRFIEIFTDVGTYEECMPSSEVALSVVSQLQMFLVSRGYFVHMKALIDARLPPGMDMDHLPPLATSIESILFRPIRNTLQNDQLGQSRSEMLRCLCRDLFSEQFSDQISSFLLPVLTRKSILPLSDLLDALLENPRGSHIHSGLRPTVWLLYAVMSLTGPNLKSLPTPYIVKYLYILQALLPCLPSAETQQRIQDMEDDSDTEDNIFMEIEEIGSAQTVSEIREHCLQQFNTPDYVQFIRAAADTDNVTTLTALCRICHLLMTEHKLHVPRTSLLCTLACNARFLQHIWQAAETVSTPLVTGTQLPLLHVISRGIPLSKEDTERIVPLLSVFSSLFGHLLQSLHDSEFIQKGGADTQQPQSLMPFSLQTLVPLSLALRNACLGIIDLAYPETRPVVMEEYFLAMTSQQASERQQLKKDFDRQCDVWLHCFKVTSQLVKQLFERDSRLSFCPPGHWIAPAEIKLADLKFSSSQSLRPTRLSFWNGSSTAEEEEGPPMTTHDSRRMAILAELPFLVSFANRVQIFSNWVHSRREERDESVAFNSSKTIMINVRRDFLYEDAFDRLRPENEADLHKKLSVQMRNFHGLDEAGVDGGGITREFLSQLLKTAFDPNRGFFRATADGLLYPNPQAAIIHPDFTKHYYFMGRILGKCLYEKMLVELPLASFFLSKILSRHSDVDIHHLASLDPVIYKNLLSLKDYEGDVADLGLNFTVVDDNLGEAKVYELKPGGDRIPVTDSNRIEYIHLMADFRLNKQIRPHILNFRAGIANVTDVDWLRMFDHRELQVLISGASVPIDVDDMRLHTNYAGDFNESHPLIRDFWEVVRELTDEQKRSLLKFITSCSRPPLLGFKELYPAICIHSAGKEDRLPTASTCMNLLKLPQFKDKQLLRTRLLYAIESGAGFELS